MALLIRDTSSAGNNEYRMKAYIRVTRKLIAALLLGLCVHGFYRLLVSSLKPPPSYKNSLVSSGVRQREFSLTTYFVEGAKAALDLTCCSDTFKVNALFKLLNKKLYVSGN